jgi:hypothetical protein
VPDEEELRVLDQKLKQLKLDYDRYFLGSRPREPVVLRSDVEKLIAIYSNQAITNSGLRFRFSSLCSRYQALKRQWSEILRQIEQGTYARHRFKAVLHERVRGAPVEAPQAEAAEPLELGEPVGVALFDEYRAARERCGQETRNLSPASLARVLAEQREALRARFGDAEFRFRVVIEDGRAKIKASRVGAAGRAAS